MKKFLLLLIIFQAARTLAQDINEQSFKAEVEAVLQDGRTGFNQTIGNYRETNFGHRYYDTNASIFSLGSAKIIYHPFEYFVTIRETEPEDFWFVQDFNMESAAGNFVLNNGERVMDELADAMRLKKIVENKKRKDKKPGLRVITYSDKLKNKVLELKFSPSERIVQITIHSTSKPADAPNYLGCLTLYNVNSSGDAVSAIAFYVYGDSIESASVLYTNALSKMSINVGRAYGKYEWQSNANRQVVHDKLKALVGTYQSERINPEGYAID